MQVFFCLHIYASKGQKNTSMKQKTVNKWSEILYHVKRTKFLIFFHSCKSCYCPVNTNIISLTFSLTKISDTPNNRITQNSIPKTWTAEISYPPNCFWWFIFSPMIFSLFRKIETCVSRTEKISSDFVSPLPGKKWQKNWSRTQEMT